MGTIKHAYNTLFQLFIVLIIFINSNSGVVLGYEFGKSSSSGGALLVPVEVGRSEYRSVLLEMDMQQQQQQQRRKLGGPFQVCLGCRCCVTPSDPTTCSNMPCCFGIDCQLPNKPFGVCAFVPKTCNCTTCN